MTGYSVEPSQWPHTMGVSMHFDIEFDQEEDGRWIAEIAALPGALVYGATQEEARSRVEVLALRIVADQLERKQQVPLT